MKKSCFVLIVIFLLFSGSIFSQNKNEKGWKAGVARTVITPTQSMWMAGFASRTHASEGKLHDLWIKALALEDADGQRSVLVTMDLLGLSKPISDAVRDQLKTKYNLSKAQIILNSSHTHSGPVLTNALVDIYPLNADEQKKIDKYSEELIGKIVTLVGNAFNDLKPATLHAQNGVTRFEVNRRNNDAATLETLTELRGPSDHAVPVIKVTNGKGDLLAVVFGYACHPTVLDGYNWSGDYVGYAQIELEKLYPGTTAMFFQGAGADQNPLPRHTIPLAIQYGKTLAVAVERVISEDMKPLSPKITMAYREIDLGLNAAPTREQLTKMSEKVTGYQQRWALHMLERMKQGEKFPTSYPYPLQVWKLGDQSIMALGGELVVGYAINLKRIFGRETFVMGYSNDVMTYIPTSQILREGGYEGEIAQIVYGLPATWTAEVETEIMNGMIQLAKQAGVVKPESKLVKD